jgi:hypothetical protein
MQLRTARLCLDCEEVHDAQQCPVCASETFAYLTRWVPVPERRQRPRPTEPAVNETATAYRQIMQPPPQTPWRAIRNGAVGLALFGVAGWLWQRSGPRDATTPKKTTGSARGGTP